MKLALFGGSGGTGRLIAERALEAGHELRILARDPTKVRLAHQRLTVIRGDVRDRTQVIETISGTHCVVAPSDQCAAMRRV